MAYVRALSSLSQVVPISLSSKYEYTLSVYVGFRADQATFPDGDIRVYSNSTNTALGQTNVTAANVIKGAFVQTFLTFTPPSAVGKF